MTSYYPGRGLKKPMNMQEAPIYPEFKRGPPRFSWSGKHWMVDTGRTMAAVEKHPQLQEAAVLKQNYNYNTQHAYGKRPTYVHHVNDYFIPPDDEGEDFLPLNHNPLEIVNRINPGGAHSSGNNSFVAYNTEHQDPRRYITDKVCATDSPITYFRPMSKPDDNTRLPHMNVKKPNYSATAGFNYPTIPDIEMVPGMEFIELSHQQIHPELDAGISTRPLSRANPSGKEDLILDYQTPQISASAGMKMPFVATTGTTTRAQDEDRVYNRPQISGWAGINQINRIDGEYHHNLELVDNRPQYSASSGVNTHFHSTDLGTRDRLDLVDNRPKYSTSSGVNTRPMTMIPESGLDPREVIGHKLEGSQPATAGMNMSHIAKWNHEDCKNTIDQNKIGHERPTFSYAIPHNTKYKDQTGLVTSRPGFQQKVSALGNYKIRIHQSSIPRAGISDPNIKLKSRKDR